MSLSNDLTEVSTESGVFIVSSLDLVIRNARVATAVRCHRLPQLRHAHQRWVLVAMVEQRAAGAGVGALV